MCKWLAVCVGAALLTLAPLAALAQGATDVFKGRTIDVYTGYTVGFKENSGPWGRFN